MTTGAQTVEEKKKVSWTRLVAMFVGIGLFVSVYVSPPWPDAVSPSGEHFALSREGKAALAVFFLAGTWWVFEVVPIGVTSLLIGVLQAFFLIRAPEAKKSAKLAFNDFMDPSVVFIFASIVIGLVYCPAVDGFGCPRRTYRPGGTFSNEISLFALMLPEPDHFGISPCACTEREQAHGIARADIAFPSFSSVFQSEPAGRCRRFRFDHAGFLLRQFPEAKREVDSGIGAAVGGVTSAAAGEGQAGVG